MKRDTYNENEYEYNEPLDTNTFLNTLDYADKKQDSRLDALLKCLGHIEFWVTIIGIYFLIKFVIAIFAIIFVTQGSNEILDLLSRII